MQRRSTISRIFFLWVSPFIAANAKRPLTAEDLLELPPEFDSETQFSKLITGSRRCTKGPCQLLRAVIFSVRVEIIRVLLLSLVLLALGLITPLIVRQLLLALEGKIVNYPYIVQEVAKFTTMSTGRVYSLFVSVVLFCTSISSMVFLHHLYFTQVGIGIKVNSSLRSLIYKKAMRLSREEKNIASSGHVMGLVGTDSFRVMHWMNFIHAVWYHPLQVTFTLILLFQLLGVSSLVGAGTLFLLLVITGSIVRFQNKSRRAVLSAIDKRLGCTSEVLSHMKIVKFQAWEEPLRAKIEKFRVDEVKGLSRINKLSSIVGFLANLGPPLALLATLITHLLFGGALDASTVFPAMGLFILLRFALNTLPDTISNTVEAVISLGRIERFVKRAEFSPHNYIESTDKAIRIANVVFHWGENSPAALIVDDLVIERGDLVVVIGGVGGGKSALLLGLLGEIPYSGGGVDIQGSFGYVAQQPWITSDTIKGNIIASRDYDSMRYQTALRASALEKDLSQFELGDQTGIGERGVNLSGGQRQRVALARAYYGNSEIYLFDDPLSALDPKVANDVFEELICRELVGSTRILVTHRLEFVSQADKVLVIENGRIIQQGTPKELMNDRDGRFVTLLGVHQEISGSHLLGSSEADFDPSVESSFDKISALSTQNESLSPDVNRGADSVIAAEEQEVGAVNPSVVLRYLDYFMPGWIALLIVFIAIGRHITSFSTDLWITSFARGEVDNITLFIGGYSCFVLVLGIFHFLRWYLFLSAGIRAGVRAHSALLTAVLAAPLRFFESNPVGRILNRFSRDLETIESYIPKTLLDFSHCFLELVVLGLLLISVDTKVLFVIIPVIYAYFSLQRKIRPTGREAQRIESIARSPVFAHFSESLNGVDTIRSSGLLRIFEEKLSKFLNAHSRALYTITASNRWVGLRLELLAAIIVLGAGLTVSFLSNSSGSTALTGLVLIYVINCSGAMNWFVRSLVLAESQLTSFERMLFYTKTISERQGQRSSSPDWPIEGEIEFKSLTIKYRPELDPALDSITCVIPPTSRVGIIGRTGSGKSTLVLAIARILEADSGSIFIDGLDISEISLTSLRNALTIVPQEPVLFSGPLRETLDPFNNAKDDLLWNILERVELADFVKTLPGSLDYVIHEGGQNISSGQRQLLCLARALLRGSRIIILDEATASIDVETDQCIQRAIRREFKNSTVLVVAHRLGTVIDSDLLMVLEGGKLKDFGHPDTIMSRYGTASDGFTIL